MRLPPPGKVGGVNDVPVLQAILHDAAVERVVELPVDGLEVSVAMVVGLLIGGQVVQHHLELRECGKCMNIGFQSQHSN